MVKRVAITGLGRNLGKDRLALSFTSMFYLLGRYDVEGGNE